jgi:type IV pilus assembly protein PilW
MNTNLKKQVGAGLIEIMIAITIGLFLILGVSTFFLSVKKTFTDRQGMAALQNGERLAMSFLSAAVHNAGYYPNPLSAPPFTANQILFGTGNGGGSDTLTVRFAAPSGDSVSPFQGCTETLIPGNIYTNTFSVSSGNLVCTEVNVTANTSTKVNLVNGLSGLNVLYGVDTLKKGSVTAYKNASSATWDSIKTVVVTLSFNNPLYGQPGQPATTSSTQTISNLIGP